MITAHQFSRQQKIRTTGVALLVGVLTTTASTACAETIPASSCEDRTVAIHLVVSSAPSRWPRFGPKPIFTKCSDCIPMTYEVAGFEEDVRISPAPVLRIGSTDVSESQIFVQYDLYDPPRLLHQLRIVPNVDMAERISKLVETNRNDRFAARNCSRLTNVGWISPGWKLGINVGVFPSEADAIDFAKQLDLRPDLVPYDKERDDETRTLSIRSILDEYSEYPDAKERIESESPELFQFLERHPEHWKFLEAESESSR